MSKKWYGRVANFVGSRHIRGNAAYYISESCYDSDVVKLSSEIQLSESEVKSLLGMNIKNSLEKHMAQYSSSIMVSGSFDILVSSGFSSKKEAEAWRKQAISLLILTNKQSRKRK